MSYTVNCKLKRAMFIQKEMLACESISVFITLQAKKIRENALTVLPALQRPWHRASHVTRSNKYAPGWMFYMSILVS